MSRLRHFLRSDRGSSAVEFTLVLPFFLLILLGTIELGRFAWEANRAEKAVQIGTRWAVATDMIPSALKDFSFATSRGVPQGSVVPVSEFPGVVCTGSSGGAASCRCAGSSCPFDLTADQGAFAALVKRMQQINTLIKPENVVVTYAWSGLGFAGDPNGPDVAPLTTVSLQNLDFSTVLLFGGKITMPTFSYSLTMEDGSGGSSN